MIVYVTRWALTKGILEVEVDEPTERAPDMVVGGSSPLGCVYYHKGQWHRTREEAERKTWDMRDKKLASLRKQITKLEDMDLG